MDNSIKTKLSDFIRDPSLEQLELKLHEPNFFYILNFQKVEIRHSNFLAWLLDPKENHRLGDLFLKRVLKDIFSNQNYDWIDEFTVDSLELSNVEIRREWNYIDILIITNDFIICIENKIDSKEHSNQLQRYINIIDTNYQNLNKAFVYLTPYGDEPATILENYEYKTYSYGQILINIENILNLHSESLSPRIKNYIEDYLLILKREIMKEEEANELAKKIYAAHKDAIDFIIENKPDRLTDVAAIFEDIITDKGNVLGSKNKGYVRFTTNNLASVIPKTGFQGWKGKEAFLFEINFWPKTITFKTVIAPGQENNRRLIAQEIAKLDGAKTPYGKQWLAHFRPSWKFDVTNSRHTDEDIRQKIEDIWPKISEIVNKVEKQLLTLKGKFKE